MMKIFRLLALSPAGWNSEIGSWSGSWYKPFWSGYLEVIRRELKHLTLRSRIRNRVLLVPPYGRGVECLRGATQNIGDTT